MEYKDNASSQALTDTSGKTDDKYKRIEEEDESQLDIAWDDVFGATLGPREVRKARAEEIQYISAMDLYEKVLKGQCYARIGEPTLSKDGYTLTKGTNPTIITGPG